MPGLLLVCSLAAATSRSPYLVLLLSSLYVFWSSCLLLVVLFLSASCLSFFFFELGPAASRFQSLSFCCVYTRCKWVGICKTYVQKSTSQVVICPNDFFQGCLRSYVIMRKHMGKHGFEGPDGTIKEGQQFFLYQRNLESPLDLEVELDTCFPTLKWPQMQATCACYPTACEVHTCPWSWLQGLAFPIGRNM